MMLRSVLSKRGIEMAFSIDPSSNSLEERTSINKFPADSDSMRVIGLLCGLPSIVSGEKNGASCDDIIVMKPDV